MKANNRLTLSYYLKKYLTLFSEIKKSGIIGMFIYDIDDDRDKNNVPNYTSFHYAFFYNL